MRLLNSATLEFEVFYGDDIPPYLILSHTWGHEEVTYQEMRFLQRLKTLPDHLKQTPGFIAALEVAADLNITDGASLSISKRAGYKKILKTAELAKEKRLQYFWVDTCSIDKTSSAELQESINSMYAWYQKSAFCVVYLEDGAPTYHKPADGAPIVLAPADGGNFKFILESCKWAKRGWTLQELIAPAKVAFYDLNWEFLAEKRKTATEICEVTRIPPYVLITGDLSRASVAQKMSWAAGRETTREEDKAYSLMGIFGVHMPMLYGEGINAFKRLQEEIIRTTSDDSIFAWRSPKGSLAHYVGLLANSPHDFAKSTFVTRGEGSFVISNLGLKIEADIDHLQKENDDHDWDEGLYTCKLDAEDGYEKNVTLLLRKLEPLKYTRVQADHFSFVSTARKDVKPVLYVEHNPKIPPQLKSHVMRCFHLKRSTNDMALRPTSQIVSVFPEHLWDRRNQRILIAERGNGDSRLAGYFGLIEVDSHKVFTTCVRIKSSTPMVAYDDNFYLLFLGYDISTGQVWCGLYETGRFQPIKYIHSDFWKRAREFSQSKTDKTHDSLRVYPRTGSWFGLNFNVRIVPGLFQGVISHIVEIDGLDSDEWRS